MSQNLQMFAKFQIFQLDSLVDFEKCCKTHIYLQKSVPIQPKTSNMLPKFCQPTLSDGSAARLPRRAASATAAATARLRTAAAGGPRGESAPHTGPDALPQRSTCRREREQLHFFRDDAY